MIMKNHVCKRDSLCVLLGNVIIPHPINLCQVDNKKSAHGGFVKKDPKKGGAVLRSNETPSHYWYSQPQKRFQAAQELPKSYGA